jgi:hypothetical protein
MEFLHIQLLSVGDGNSFLEIIWHYLAVFNSTISDHSCRCAPEDLHMNIRGNIVCNNKETRTFVTIAKTNICQ